MPERHLFLDRVDVQHVDPGAGRGAVGGGDPRHVAAGHQHHVRVREQRILGGGAPLVAQVQRVAGREVHPHRHRLDHADRRELAQLGQGGHGRRVPSQVGRDDQGCVGAGERGGDLIGHLRRQRHRGHRRPPLPLVGLGRHRLLHDLAAREQVGRARPAPRDLQGAVDELLRVAPGPDLVRVLDVATDDPGLVGRVLEPVDELVAAAGQLALGGHRRQAGQYQHRHPPPGHVVHGAAQVLGAAVDVHEYRLGLATDLGIPLRRAERDELVRAQHQFRQGVGAAVAAGLRVGLDDPGVVAAQVREQVPHAGLAHRLQQRPAHRLLPVSHRHHRPRPHRPARWPPGGRVGPVGGHPGRGTRPAAASSRGGRLSPTGPPAR